MGLKLGAPSASALSATFAPLYGPTRRHIGMAVMGDSNSSYENSGGRVWHKQLAQLTQQAARWRHMSADAGKTLEAAETDYLPSVLALNPMPEVCVIALGTNNVGAAGYSFTTTYATHGRIRAALEAVGIRPTVFLIPPRSDNATVNGHVDKWNAAMLDLAHRYGYPVIDGYGPVVDPATGGWATGMLLAADGGVHYSALGHRAVAVAASTDPRFIGRIQDGRPDLTRRKGDTANLITNGVFIGDSNADGKADSWSSWGTWTASLPAATLGNAQRSSLASGATNAGGFRQDVTVAAGDVIEVACRWRADMDPASPDTRWGGALQFRTAGGATVVTEWWVEAFGALDHSGTAYRRLVAPATATTLRVDMAFSGPAPTRAVFGEISQVTVRNLTSLGLT